VNDAKVLSDAARRRRTPVPWWSVLLMIVVFYPPAVRPFAWLTGQASWKMDLTETVAEGSAARQLQFTLLGLVAFAQLAFRREERSAPLRPNLLGWVAVVLAGLTAASLIWSDDPGLSVRRLVALGTLGLAALALRRMPGAVLLQLVFYTTLAGLTFGLAKEMAHGSFRPWDPTYRFSGTLSTPNVQGWNCALSFLAGLAIVHSRRRWKAALMLALPSACLLLTRSRTSIAALIGAALFYTFLSLLRQRRVVLVASLCLAATAGVSLIWIGQSSPMLENAVKRDRHDTGLATLQGRTDVWQDAFPYVHARPWLGYGYDVFWTPDRIEEFATNLGWRNQNGHSDYLDILLGLGYIGLCVFVCLLAMGIIRACRAAIESGSTTDLFFSALLVFCALHGLLETTLVGPSFLTLIYMTAIVRFGFSAKRSPESRPFVEATRKGSQGGRSAAYPPSHGGALGLKAAVLR
jgi:exopolysaccharide production protein ExoQ